LNPALGKFIQKDPAGYGAGMNLYDFAGNDPVNHKDPKGLEGEEVESDPAMQEIEQENVQNGIGVPPPPSPPEPTVDPRTDPVLENTSPPAPQQITLQVVKGPTIGPAEDDDDPIRLYPY
jgi:hypothetical protein